MTRRSSRSFTRRRDRIGKLNCDEFAMGSSTERSAYKPTRIRGTSSRVPGGSSGELAAVAAGLCTASLGTDTGGSIASPRRSAVSSVSSRVRPRVTVRNRRVASSLDQVGPITRHGATPRSCWK